MAEYRKYEVSTIVESVLDHAEEGGGHTRAPTQPLLPKVTVGDSGNWLGGGRTPGRLRVAPR